MNEQERMINEQTTEELFTFIRISPTAFHATACMKGILEQNGFLELFEGKRWQLQPGGSYFVTRNDSSLIAFTIPGNAGKQTPCRIMASHSDSPAFKIKEYPEILSGGAYTSLNVEKYGGMLMAPWFDRPLSVAGRLICEEDGHLRSVLVNENRDLILIPNLAIHMNRKANDGYSYNPQKDMLPLFALDDEKADLLTVVAENANINPKSILGHDLFLYNRQQGTIWGKNREFISAPRLDDLQCAFASLIGFLSAKKQNAIAVHCVFDNEEVGSTTKQGAASTFLSDTLQRLYKNLGGDFEDYLIALSDSFMISADNAHAVHPNHADLSDPVNRPLLNHGLVLKFNANQKYCTDAVSAAVFRQICKKAGIPYQTFTNRSDMAGGSTLGNISNTKVAVRTADIGLPQLAMHSPYETAGLADTGYLIRFARELFQQ